jgi:hypothetical protein
VSFTSYNITETNGSASIVGIFILRQEPTSLYGPGGKHIFELIDGFPSLLSAMLWPKLKLYVVLACKVSFIFIEIDLVAEVGDIIGSYFMGGEITNCLDF